MPVPTTRLRLGVMLQFAAIVPWLCVPVLPFLGLSAAAIGITTAVLAGLSEAMIWLGVVLIGREAYRAVKQRGWRRMPAVLWTMLRTGNLPD